jgi:hypothetical protein
MRKAQVFLREDQAAELRRVAKSTGRKQSEIIRRGVDLAVAEAVEAGPPDWRKATLAAAGMWKDHDGIDAMREDLRTRYQERLDKLFPERS